jgi:hypothetical protein
MASLSVTPSSVGIDGYVLVDYDNLLPLYQNLPLASLAQRISGTLDKLVPGLNDIYIRLYGGWYSDVGLTNKGTRIAQEALKFPLTIARQGKIVRRVFCEIASSLIDRKADTLLSTFRKRTGFRSRLAVTLPSGCADPPNCTVRAVSSWSSGACPHKGCTISTHDVFSYYEQKLVDTLLCCDLIALGTRSPSPAIFVLSDDDDMVPAFLLAAGGGASICQLQMRASVARSYGALLQKNNVRAGLL